MKTTVDLPDDLLIAAKKKAAESRRTLRSLIEQGLRTQLRTPRVGRPRHSRIKWVTSRGGLPPGLDIASREVMHEWLRRQR